MCSCRMQKRSCGFFSINTYQEAFTLLKKLKGGGARFLVIAFGAFRVPRIHDWAAKWFDEPD